MRSPVGIVYELDKQIEATRAQYDGRVRVTWRETPDGAVKTASRDGFADIEDAASFLTRAALKFGSSITDEEQRARNMRYAQIMAAR